MRSFNFKVGDTMVHREDNALRIIYAINGNGKMLLSTDGKHRGTWFVKELTKEIESSKGMYTNYIPITENLDYDIY